MEACAGARASTTCVRAATTIIVHRHTAPLQLPPSITLSIATQRGLCNRCRRAAPPTLHARKQVGRRGPAASSREGT
eukprot:2029357-Alexandrium_andersonii.AAC.1